MRKGFVSGFTIGAVPGLVVLIVALVLAGRGGGGTTSSGSSRPAVTTATTASSSSAATPAATASSPAATAAGAAAATSGSIQAAPAFTADDLAAQPATDWITNGGSTLNQRYSPLDQINDTNVTSLKGVWMTHLGGSGLAAKYSAEGQPIVYKGTIYQTTGEDDVFAVDVKTGKILWKYDGNLDQTISSVCCGWLNRGVGLGDGMVFLGKLDGSLVALDQATGKVKWTTQVTTWQSGSGITAAPLYYNGKVITGVTGGEFGVRGRVTAFDAKTGKEAWRFWTIPGPGEFGHDTWPATNDAWKHGGAPVWQTPAVDPKLGMIYFSTGNASPDINGSQRAGDNLFSASIVALDANTGKYKWHFQMVHHDIWDFDAPSPVVLFDANVNGTTVPALAEAEKTGWLYMLNRETGKPLYGITEKPVPQNAYQKTAKTQPYPSSPPFSSHTVSDAAFAAIKKQVDAINTKLPKKLKIVRGSIFGPQPKDGILVTAPDATGGTNWQPSSYNAKTQMIYVCSGDGAAGYSASDIPGFKEGESYVGSVLAVAGFGNIPGHLTAYDANSGQIKWRDNFPENCYSGTTTTAGNLVFVGRNGGQIEAYNATTGQRLWSFQTGAGANDSPTEFAMDGKEYLAFYAGGNSLAATAHGDNLWLFSLDGTLGPAKAAGAGQGTEHTGESDVPTTKGDATAGKQGFADNCSVCHGAAGTGGNGGPDLTSIPDAKDVTKVIGQITNGGGGMPAFKGTLTQKQINDIAAYVTQQITNKK